MSFQSGLTTDPPIANRQPNETVGLQLRIETPENVILNYQLAGPAARIFAYLIDLMVRIAIMFGLSVVLIPMSAMFPGSAMGFWLVALFLIQWGYYALCEGFFKGRTVGKQALGLRVIHETGHPITFWPAVLRNLVRVADGFPYLFSGVGFYSMMFSKNFQRLGDLAANTVVITERHVILPTEPVILEKIQPLSRDELGNNVPGTEVLTAIDQFLGRRYVLSHERAHEIAGVLADELARYLNFRGDQRLVQLYPMAFLARVYVTYIRRDETRDAEAETGRQTGAMAGALR